jgi:hypothetical protein
MNNSSSKIKKMAQIETCRGNSEEEKNSSFFFFAKNKNHLFILSLCLKHFKLEQKHK